MRIALNGSFQEGKKEEVMSQKKKPPERKKIKMGGGMNFRKRKTAATCDLGGKGGPA